MLVGAGGGASEAADGEGSEGGGGEGTRPVYGPVAPSELTRERKRRKSRKRGATKRLKKDPQELLDRRLGFLEAAEPVAVDFGYDALHHASTGYIGYPDGHGGHTYHQAPSRGRMRALLARGYRIVAGGKE